MFPRGTLRCMPMSRGDQVEPRPNPTCTKGAGWKAGSGEGGGLDCCLFPLASPGVITFYMPITLIQDNLAFICTLADGLQPSHLPPLGVHAKMLMIWFSFLEWIGPGVRGLLGTTRSFRLPVLTLGSGPLTQEGL